MPGPEDVGEFRTRDTSTTIPLIAIKRLGVGATVFLVYSALSGLAYAAEFSGLLLASSVPDAAIA